MKWENNIKKGSSICPESRTTALSTGLTEFDQLSHGLQQSTLYLIAARPAMGKRALALTLARHIALDQKLPVVYFIPAISEKQLKQLILRAESEIEPGIMKPDQLTKSNAKIYEDASRKVDTSPFYICTEYPLTTKIIRSSIEHLQRENPLKAVFIDYLQLILDERQDRKPNTSYETITGELKLVAEEYKVPVLLLTQLTRQLEQRENRRPVLKDLSAYGNIEERADVVLFIYRNNYYQNRIIPSEIAEINIAKNLPGKTGYFKLIYLEQYSKFLNCSTLTP